MPVRSREDSIPGRFLTMCLRIEDNRKARQRIVVIAVHGHSNAWLYPVGTDLQGRHRDSFRAPVSGTGCGHKLPGFLKGSLLLKRGLLAGAGRANRSSALLPRAACCVRALCRPAN